MQRSAETLVRAVVAALLLVALGSCAASSSKALQRPAVLGASLSSGADSWMPASDAGDELALNAGVVGTVDLASALDAVLVAPETPKTGPRRFLSFADGAAFLAPVDSLRRQVDAAMASQATSVIAIDGVFWCVYGPVDPTVSDEGESERLRRLGDGLAQLDRLGVPLLLGDVPDVRREVARQFGSAPHPDTLAEAVRRMDAWSTARPRVALFPLAELHRKVVSGERLELPSAAGAPPSIVDGVGLMANDLHATAEGQLLLASLVAVAIDRAGWVPDGTILRSIDQARPRLAARTVRLHADRRAVAAAEEARLARLGERRAVLDARLAAIEAQASGRETGAPSISAAASELWMVMDHELVLDRSMMDLLLLRLRLERWRGSNQPELRRVAHELDEATRERARLVILAATRDDASPELLATAIEWWLHSPGGTPWPEATAMGLARRLGEAADAERRAGSRGSGAVAWRLAELVFLNAKTHHPELAAAVVKNAQAWSEAIRQRQDDAEALRTLGRQRGIDLPRSRGDEQAELIRVLERAGRTSEAEALRRGAG